MPIVLKANYLCPYVVMIRKDKGSLGPRAISIRSDDFSPLWYSKAVTEGMTENVMKRYTYNNVMLMVPNSV